MGVCVKASLGFPRNRHKTKELATCLSVTALPAVSLRLPGAPWDRCAPPVKSGRKAWDAMAKRWRGGSLGDPHQSALTVTANLSTQEEEGCSGSRFQDDKRCDSLWLSPHLPLPGPLRGHRAAAPGSLVILEGRPAGWRCVTYSHRHRLRGHSKWREPRLGRLRPLSQLQRVQHCGRSCRPGHACLDGTVLRVSVWKGTCIQPCGAWLSGQPP